MCCTGSSIEFIFKTKSLKEQQLQETSLSCSLPPDEHVDTRLAGVTTMFVAASSLL